MDAAEEHNALERFGVSGVTGVPEPDRPQELGRQFAYSEAQPASGAGE